MTLRQRQSSADENETSTLEQISDAQSAMDENATGNQSLVNYYPLFIMFGRSIDELNHYVDEFKKISASFGVAPICETYAARVSWFAQIPGFDVFPRSFKLLSRTAAISIPMSSRVGLRTAIGAQGHWLYFQPPKEHRISSNSMYRTSRRRLRIH